LFAVPTTRVQLGRLTVLTHGPPDVVIPLPVWQKLASGPYLDKPVLVEVVPRSLVRELWARDMGSKPFPGAYAFRAYTRGCKVVLLSDATETAQSLVWLLLHELAHVQVNDRPLLEEAFRSTPRPPGYVSNDEAHEAWPEERFANQMADALAPSFGSRPGLNRLWWRTRTP
jgi:hypothetical protein